MGPKRMANFLLNLYGDEIAPVAAERHLINFQMLGDTLGVEAWEDVLAEVKQIQAQRRSLH